MPAGKQLEFLVFKDSILHHVSGASISVDHFVKLEDTLPQKIGFRNFSASAVINGEDVGATMPVNVLIDPEKFPILAVMTEDELLTFSPATEPDFSLTQALYGVSEQAFGLLSGMAQKLFLSSSEDKLRAFVMTRMCNEHSAGRLRGVSGDPLKNFVARLAALRLFDLTFIYKFLEDHGEVVLPLLYTEKPLLAKLRTLGLQGSEQQVADLRVFAQFHRLKEKLPADWEGYERRCQDILTDSGYDLEYSSTGNDLGADIVCSKAGLTYVVQCKFHASPVGIKAVQEASTALLIYGGVFAGVESDSGFTSSAFEAARKNSVLLVTTGQLANIDLLSR